MFDKELFSQDMIIYIGTKSYQDIEDYFQDHGIEIEIKSSGYMGWPYIIFKSSNDVILSQVLGLMYAVRNVTSRYFREFAPNIKTFDLNREFLYGPNNV